MRLFKNVTNIDIYRYGIISPVLHGSEQIQNEYFRQLSETGIKIPPGSGNIFHLNPSTFKRWLRQYRKHGLQGLKEKNRSDKGSHRKIPANLLDAIAAITQEIGVSSVSDLHRKLLMAKHITHETLSYETLRQLVARHQLLSPEKNPKPRKKFEKEFINELWMVDFKQGKSIRQGTRLRRSYLCAIIDDASRLLVGYQWGLNEDTTLFARTFKKAIAIYGIPQILYSDQGKVFCSHYIFPVDNPQRLFLFDQGRLIKELKPVNLVANANPPHISTSYSTLLRKDKP